MKTSSLVILGLAFVLAAKTTLAAPLPPVTGTIASNRLGEEQVKFLQAADHTQVCMNHITPGDGTSQHMTSGYVVQTNRRGSRFSQRLANVLLNDKTYASAPDFQDAGGHSQNFSPIFSFRIYNTADEASFMDVSVDPNAQELRVMAPFAKREHHPTELYANYTLLAPQLTSLIKEAFPSSPQAQAIKAWPAYKRPIPASIPAAVQAQIATLRPGMTRGDLLKLFGTEGGLSSRTWRTYVWRGATIPEQAMVQQNGAAGTAKTMTFAQFIKVDVEFMPKEAHLQWINGAGILIDPLELYRFGTGGEAASDIIVRISPPYLALPVDD
jgi:hypothetical protein